MGSILTGPSLVGGAGVALPNLEGVAGDLLSVGVVNAEVKHVALDLDVHGSEGWGGEADSGEESGEHCDYCTLLSSE